MTFKLTTNLYRIYPKYSDTLNVRTRYFFLKRHLFYVPYISRHVPNRVFLLSINVRTQKTGPVFLIKLSFFTTEIFCQFALFTCVSGVPVYLAPWTGCPPGGKPTMDGLPPRGATCPGISYPPPWLPSPPGATYPGWFILPPGGEVKPAGLSCPPPMNFEQ